MVYGDGMCCVLGCLCACACVAGTQVGEDRRVVVGRACSSLACAFLSLKIEVYIRAGQVGSDCDGSRFRLHSAHSDALSLSVCCLSAHRWFGLVFITAVDIVHNDATRSRTAHLRVFKRWIMLLLW